MKAILSILFLFVFSCSNTTQGQKPTRLNLDGQAKKEKVERVILFIGDGMGVGAIGGTQYLADEKLQMLSMPEFGWMSTHSYEFVTTDSAASASAISSGEKTHFNGVGVRPGTSEKEEEDPAHHLESFFDLAKSKGWGRGIVSTSRVVHATPAAFYAHRKTRKSYDKIAEDLLTADLDVVLGAGWKYFRERKDGRDLVAELKAQSYDYLEDPLQLDAYTKSSRKMVGLFYKKDMPFLADEKRTISLPEMVNSAIKVLDRGHPEGWVLMVEGSFIDWCEHALRPGCTFKETKDFDDALALGRRYAASRSQNDTLIVVTADHETGGLSIIDPPFAEEFSKQINPDEGIQTTAVQSFEMGSYFNPEMATIYDKRIVTNFGSMSAASAMVWKKKGRFYAAHTANFVPIFAQGPGAKFIAQSRDNATLGRRIKSVLVEEGAFSARPKKKEKPKNIVLLVGSGMGIASLTYGYYANGSSAAMELEEHGIVAPQFSKRIIPTGRSTLGALCQSEKKDLIQHAIDQGKSVGIITGDMDKSSIHAFHSPKSVGAKLINLTTKYPKGIALVFGESLSPIDLHQLKKPGYDIQRSWPPQESEKAIIGIFSTKPSLKETLGFAISHLEKNEKGYLIIAEFKGVDARLSTFELSALLDELSEFDDALNMAKAKVTKDTLLLFTANYDHTMSVLDNHYAFVNGRCGATKRCGGEYHYDELDVLDREGFGRKDLQGDFEPKIILQYAWLIRAAQHVVGYKSPKIAAYPSANFVPLFAQGPGAELFRGFHKQQDIGKILNDL